MKLTPTIQKAINLAAYLHFGQSRRGIERPYIVHPFSVAIILSQYTKNENIIAAGLMHDVLEDVEGYNYADLKKDFGSKIAKIVKEVSEDRDPDDAANPKSTWDLRKIKYLKNLANDSRAGMMVTAADKIHNLQSMMEAYQERREKLWEKFNAPLEKKLWFYGEVLIILKKRLNNKIVKELEKTYKQAKKFFA
jgi:(p)ppGpp synthase/HD superfamily hydrolase